MVNRNHSTALAAALCLSMPLVTNTFCSFDEFFDQHMTMMQEIRDSLKAETQTLFSDAHRMQLASIDDTHTDVVTLTINNVTAESFDAVINDEKNALVITTPSSTIKVYIDQVYKNNDCVTVVMSQETKAVAQEKETTENKAASDKQEDNASTYESYTKSSSQHAQVLQGTIDIDGLLNNPSQVITYDKQKNVLVITLPKKVMPLKKQLPVTIVGDEKTEQQEAKN